MTATERILILGATGLLGSSLQPFLAGRGRSVIAHGHLAQGAAIAADLTDWRKTDELLRRASPDVIINLVALTDVDRCEVVPDEAYRVNVRVVENVARWIRESAFACHLIQLSTDHVYDGNGPHAEDQVAPRNIYAFSKYAGDLVAVTVSGSVLRTNFFGRSRCDRRRSLTDWLFGAMKAGTPIQVFDDVLFSPLSIRSLCEFIDAIIETKPPGFFNLGSRQGMSKADFAYAFAEELNLPTTNVTRTTIGHASCGGAYRPRDMRMNCSKMEKAIGMILPSLRQEIERTAEEYR